MANELTKIAEALRDISYTDMRRLAGYIANWENEHGLAIETVMPTDEVALSLSGLSECIFMDVQEEVED